MKMKKKIKKKEKIEAVEPLSLDIVPIGCPICFKSKNQLVGLVSGGAFMLMTCLGCGSPSLLERIASPNPLQSPLQISKKEVGYCG